MVGRTVWSNGGTDRRGGHRTGGDGVKIPENYFLSEVHDPKYVDMRRIDTLAENGAIVQYETQKDGAMWLKVYKERKLEQ